MMETETLCLLHVHLKLHLGVDAAEDMVGAGLRKEQADMLARLLIAAVELQVLVEHLDIVRAGIPVFDGERLADGIWTCRSLNCLSFWTIVSVSAAAEALGADAVRLSAAVAGSGLRVCRKATRSVISLLDKALILGRSGDRVGRWTIPLR